MDSITEVPKQADRFLSSDNPVIALEAIFIAILLAFIIWKEKINAKKDEETIKVQRDLAAAVSELNGALNARE